ncbi:unnamed protein product [Cochlearia groenlandica]
MKIWSHRGFTRRKIASSPAAVIRRHRSRRFRRILSRSAIFRLAISLSHLIIKISSDLENNLMKSDDEWMKR